MISGVLERPVRSFIDLDDTTIDTYGFWQASFDEIARHYPVYDPAVEGVRERMIDFYAEQKDGLPATYDFDAHLRALGLEGETDSIYDLLTHSERLKQQQLETPGTKELIEHLRQMGQVAILTFGYERIQRVKVSVSPSLEGVRLLSILKAKDEFLINTEEIDPANETVVMLDDTNWGDEMSRAGVKFIQTPFTETSKKRASKPGRKVWPVRADDPFEAIEIVDSIVAEIGAH